MLKVYNTLTRRKEIFQPVKAGEVSIYCCGVTPYNHPHIGNARPFVTWDVIRRYFAKLGYKVRYVQNFTDVDDKIIRAANAEKTTWKEISDRYIASYFQSMDALNVHRADVYPRVSETIPEIIAMVKTLVEKGYAYPLDGDVYFSVEKFKEYGKLSGRKLEDMQAGARIEVNESKHHPMDFALWKAAKPGEPSWESPWGQGRPGWHIECSAMSLKYLGKTFDFHGGGSDLIFPHHENEIAQSQACIGDTHSFARYWLHNGFITINDEKMSKSKHNFFTVPDILKKYSGETVRFFILQKHYRSPLDFSDERLQEAQAGLERLQHANDCAAELSLQNGEADTAQALLQKAEACQAGFREAMDDDFNTALAIGYMFDLAKEINIYYQAVVNDGAAFAKAGFAKAKAVYDEMAEVIGIFETETATQDDGLVDGLMECILSIRQEARAKRDWATADKIRDGLDKIGIVIEDSPHGARWKKA
jgi:cysteinyl-tRNA synthetase